MTNQEINEAVARKLHGDDQCPGHLSDFGKEHSPCGWPPNYAGSIQAAWEIVEFIKGDISKGYDVHLRVLANDRFSVNFKVFNIQDKKSDDPLRKDTESTVFVSEYAESAPMAICLAFLKLPDS